MGIQRLRALTGRPTIVALLALTSACGGGGDGGNGGTGPSSNTPASISFDAGSTAQGIVGLGLTSPVTVVVRTSDGRPVAGVSVQFSASAGSVAIAAAQTDAQGRASAGAWTLGTVSGTQTLTAQAGALTAQLMVTAAARTAVRLEFLTPLPSSVRAGAPISPAPAVRGRDQFNNVSTNAGLLVTASFQTGTGVLTGRTVTTDASGIATFSTLTVGGALGTRVLAFEAPLLPVLPSDPVAVEPGLAATILIENTPATARAGEPIAPFVAAVVSDQFGNVVSRPPVNVVVTIASGGGTLVGSTASTDANGRATFGALTIEGAVGDKLLRFSADQASATTAPIPLVAGAPAALRVTAQPSQAENTLAFSAPVIVLVTDRFGNAVGGATRTVTASLASGGGALLPAVAVTDGSGVATFGTLRIVGVIGPRTLSFATPGLANGTSAAITLQAGPVRSLSLFAAPSGVITAGSPFPQQPVLQLADTSGNTIRRPGILVRAALLDAAGQLVNDAAVSDQAGLAAFRQLTFVASASSPSLRLRFGSGGLAALTTGSVTIQAAGVSSVRSVEYGAASKRLFVADPGQTFPLTAVARDAGGQSLPGVSMVYTSLNAAVASVGSSGAITGEATGSAWVRAFGAGAPSFTDSIYVTVTRDAAAPVVSTTQVTPVLVRQGIFTEFDVLLDTRATTVGAATILIGMPPELVDGLSWQGSTGTIIGLDHQLNNLRISLVVPEGLRGTFAIARLRLNPGAPAGGFLNREIVITPLEMVSTTLQDLAPRSTGVNIPLIP